MKSIDIMKDKTLGIQIVVLALLLLTAVLVTHLPVLTTTVTHYWWLPVQLGAVILVVVAHELLHGSVFYGLRRKVVFGAKWKTPMGPVFYASCPGEKFNKTQYVLMALAPQLLTIPTWIYGVVLPYSLLSTCLLYCAAMNFGGAAADFYMVAVLLKSRKTQLVEDTKTGMNLYEEGD